MSGEVKKFGEKNRKINFKKKSSLETNKQTKKLFGQGGKSFTTNNLGLNQNEMLHQVLFLSIHNPPHSSTPPKSHTHTTW